MIDKLNPTNEPISASAIATIALWAGARYGLGLDKDTADAIGLVVFVVGQFVARALSVPLAKHDKVIQDITQAKQG